MEKKTWSRNEYNHNQILKNILNRAHLTLLDLGNYVELILVNM